jgi:hypothetical protein
MVVHGISGGSRDVDDGEQTGSKGWHLLLGVTLEAIDRTDHLAHVDVTCAGKLPPLVGR